MVLALRLLFSGKKSQEGIDTGREPSVGTRLDITGGGGPVVGKLCRTVGEHGSSHDLRSSCHSFLLTRPPFT